MDLDNEVLEKAVEAVGKADQIMLCAMGNASGIALSGAALLMSMGFDAFTVSDYLLQIRTAVRLGKKDVLIAISYDGQAKTTGDSMMLAKKGGASVILITSVRDSLLSKYADYILYTPARTGGNSMNITATSLCQMSILHVLALGAVTRYYDRVSRMGKHQMEFSNLSRYDIRQKEQYSRGWTDFAGMIEDAKANPVQIRYSTVFGSTTQYVGQMLEKLAGVQFDNIDVGTSSGDRLAAMLGGQVDIAAFNYTNIADYVEAGDLVVLGVMAEDHVDGIDFPTFKELGYDIVSQKKYEVKFPKGTDPAIVEKLVAACKEVVEDPEFAEVLKTYYAEPLYRDAAQMNTEDPAEVEELRAGLAQ